MAVVKIIETHTSASKHQTPVKAGDVCRILNASERDPHHEPKHDAERGKYYGVYWR